MTEVKQPDDILLASYIAGECSTEERASVEKWLSTDSENRAILERLERISSIARVSGNQWDSEKLWQKIVVAAGISTAKPPKYYPGNINRVFRRIPLWGYTAALVLVVAVTILSLLNVKSVFTYTNHLEIGYGKVETIELTDGSKVTLDAGSTFRYNDEFTGGFRSVYLEGEAYFDIASNSAKPFQVNTPTATIEVLGTRFNVASWPSRNDVEVAVIEGRVNVRERSGNEAVIITRGMVARLQDHKIAVRSDVEVDNYITWMQHNAIFKNQPLVNIISTLERWHNIEIILPDDSVAQERLTINMPGESLENILHTISVLTGLSYKRTGQIIEFFVG